MVNRSSITSGSSDDLGREEQAGEAAEVDRSF